MGPDLRGVEIDDIFGELRRRNISSIEVSQQLGKYHEPMDPNTRLKLIALAILGIVAAALIAVVAIVSVKGGTVSSVLSGLAGSAIGAIAGILAGGATSGPETGQN